MFIEEIVDALYSAGFLDKSVQDDNEVFHIVAPSYIYCTQKVMDTLKSAYLPDEELGGILWARPSRRGTEIYYEIDTVRFIRNAIEDKPRADKRTRKNAYIEDQHDYIAAYQTCIDAHCLPFSFHTHPTRGTSFFQELVNTMGNWETSDQDVKESARHEWSKEEVRVLLPRVLVVGHDNIPGNFWVGVYGGMVAPTSFETSKEEVMRQNIDSFLSGVMTIKLTPGQKLLAFAGLAVLLGLAIKHRKSSGPVIFALLALIPAFLHDTDQIDNPPYYCKTHANEAKIYIPNLKSQQELEPVA